MAARCEIGDLPDELLVLILVMAGEMTRVTSRVSRRWQRLVATTWPRLHWQDPYYRRPMEGERITMDMYPAGFPLCRAMIAAVNGDVPPMPCMKFKGEITELLWNGAERMFEARCARETVYGVETNNGLTRCAIKKPGMWTQVTKRGRMQAEKGPPRQIEVDGRVHDFGKTRGVYGGWSKHGRLFFLTKSANGVQFERFYLGDHSIVRPRYQPTHVIITDHNVLFFYKDKVAHVLCFRYR